jgi:murein DD-endopeptidase MepM/ murein hydrolase activator NlpD
MKLFLTAVALVALSLTGCTYAPRPVITQKQNRPLTPGEMVEVRPGDTVYSIAQRNNVVMSDVIVLNKLKSPFTLKVGSRLTLPAKDIMVSPSAVRIPEEVGSSFTLDSTDTQGVQTYQQIDAEPLAQPALNPGPAVAPPAPRPIIKEEKVIYAPKVREFVSPDAMPRAIVQPAVKAPAPVKNDVAAALAVKPQAAMPVEIPPPQLKAVPVVNTPGVKKNSPTGKNDFVWPVQGPLLSSYGPKANGLKNDGINIGAPRGTPVIAGDGGTVAYAGSDIPGFGNVVLVRHPNGLMTTYGHLERMFVQKDMVVAKGDMLGTVGTSGGLDTPQLHFEIRRGNEALDPARYLGK